MLRALVILSFGLVAGCAAVLGDDFDIVGGDGGGAVDPCGVGFKCVPPTPSGFTGPVVRASAASLPSCPTGFDAAYAGFSDVTADPVTCLACSCTIPTVNCVLSPVSAHSAFQCAIPPGPVTINQSPTCGGTMAVDNYLSFVAEPPTADVGPCMPESETDVDTRPDVVWSNALLCSPAAPPGDACGTDGVCLPLAGSADFDEAYCVFGAGDVECPAPFLVKHLVSDSDTDFDDMRGCSACGCGTGSGTCEATTRIYGSLNICMGVLKATIPNDGNCHDASNEFANAVELIATVTSDGSCPATGGEATGTVAATGPFTTVCCTP